MDCCQLSPMTSTVVAEEELSEALHQERCFAFWMTGKRLIGGEKEEQQRHQTSNWREQNSSEKRAKLSEKRGGNTTPCVPR